MKKLILCAALIAMSATFAYADENPADTGSNTDQQTCQIQAQDVICIGGATAWDQGCEAKCEAGQTAVCMPASGWSQTVGSGPTYCDLTPSDCFCQ